MAQTYYTLLTTAGRAYEAACRAAGKPILLAAMSVGDGGGAGYDPKETATTLKREVWRGDLIELRQDEEHSTWLVAGTTIPFDVGGWTIREVGIWTATGELYAVGRFPDSLKPGPDSGSPKEFLIRTVIETSNAAEVHFSIANSEVAASREWAQQQLDLAIALHEAKPDPHPQYMTLAQVKALMPKQLGRRFFFSSGV